MKIRLLTTCFVLLWLPFFAHAQNESECKYLTVITYLRTNKEINEKIKSTFYKKPNKKMKYVEFNLSDWVDFIGIRHFEERLKPDIHGISKQLIYSEKLYHEKYFFESYKSDFLRELNIHSETKLYLTFSKPVDDYLVAEIGTFDPAINRNVKFGLGMQIFFKFDSNGLIEEVLYGVSAYN